MNCVKTVRGDEALECFTACLDAFFQADATGKSYVVAPKADLYLEMMGLSGCAVERIASDAAEDASRLTKYHMIVVDFGNTRGKSWQAICHPNEKVFNFVGDVLDLAPARGNAPLDFDDSRPCHEDASLLPRLGLPSGALHCITSHSSVKCVPTKPKNSRGR